MQNIKTFGMKNILKITRCFYNIHITNFNRVSSCLRHPHNMPVISHMGYSTQSNLDESKVTLLMDQLKGMGVQTQDLYSVLDASPSLLHSSPHQWHNCFSILRSHGFTTRKCLRMVAIEPSLLKQQQDQLEESLGLWRNCQLGEQNLISIFKLHPILLCIPKLEISRRIPLLRYWTSSKGLSKLLKSSPKVMLENWKAVEVKFNYLQNVMKVDVAEIVNCSALNLRLEEIELRHMFLERSGKYVVRNVKAGPEELSLNPKLEKITDTSEQHFAVKVAGMTLEEFEVFRELFEEERKKHHLDDDE